VTAGRPDAAPSGDFGNTLTINCDNPTMSAQVDGRSGNSTNLITGYLVTSAQWRDEPGRYGDPDQLYGPDQRR